MKELIEEVWVNKTVLLNELRTERVLASERLTDTLKIEILSNIIDEQRHIIWFILWDN